ncbi:MAG: hypothetical protein ABIA63_03495, partial [bacterium]
MKYLFTTFSFILILAAAASPRLFFESGFEAVQSLSMELVKQGTNKIILAPVEQVIPDSGMAMIEPGSAERREYFYFTKQAGFVLMSARALRYEHKPFCRVIIGGLNEWSKIISNKISVDTNSISGPFSAVFPIVKNQWAVLVKTAENIPDIWIQLSVRFSRELFPFYGPAAPPQTRLGDHLFKDLDTSYLAFLNLTGKRFSLHFTSFNKTRKAGLYIVFPRQAFAEDTTVQRREIPLSIEPDSVYDIAVHFFRNNGMAHKAQVFVNGREYFSDNPIIFDHGGFSQLMVGHCRPHSEIHGSMTVDNVLLSDRPIKDYREKTDGFYAFEFNEPKKTPSPLKIITPDAEKWRGIPVLRRNRWYDLNIKVEACKDCGLLRFMDVWWHPVNKIGMDFKERRIIEFDPADYYWTSLSMGDKSLWTKDSISSSGFKLITGDSALYADDRNSFLKDSEEGSYNMKLRLLEQSQIGAWVMKTGAVFGDDKKEHNKEMLFLVVDENFRTGFTLYRTTGTVAAAFLMLSLIMVFRIRKKQQKI